LVGGADRHGPGALDVAVDVRDRQTTLFGLLYYSVGREDGRIDESELRPVDVDHRQSLGAAHLRRGEADALGGVHRLEHVGDELAQLVGDLGDGLCRLAKYRVAQHPDVEDAHPAVTLEAAVGLLIFAIRPRSTITRVSPDFIV